METREKQRTHIIAIIALVLVLAGTLTAFAFRYRQMERQACETRLKECAQSAARQVMAVTQRSIDYMETVSDIVYDAFETSEAAGRETLAGLGSMGMIQRLELFRPNGILYTATGRIADPTMTYSRMAAQGVGSSRRGEDQQDRSRQIVRLHVPIVRNGETVALLCGVVCIDDLDDTAAIVAYEGQSQLFLMEGETGNYLVDPWHKDSPGGLRELETAIFSRGYDKNLFFRQVRTGNSGLTVFRIMGESCPSYVYYSPVGFQDWTVMLAVPEPAVLAKSNSMVLLFGALILLVSVMMVSFLCWLIWDMRRRERRSAVKLETVRYILEVQQTLFRAHINAQAFEDALVEMARHLTADAAVLYFLGQDGQLTLQALGGSSSIVPPKKADLAAFFPQAVKTVLEKGHFAVNRPVFWGGKDGDSAKKLSVRNMMLIRLDTLDGSRTLGVLGAINTDVFWEDTGPLDQVSLTFNMAVENYQNYQTLSYMSQVDELTGLMNRNSYHMRVEELDAMEGGTVGCVYLDANGLHEINNHLGHDAGDEMLRSVADTLLDFFDKKDTFRLGGDEFAVLVRSMSQEELERKAKGVQEAVSKCGYSVSMGSQWERGELHIPQLIASAEAAMRQNKADFYASQGGERQMRNLNTRMEQTLAAKRDADTLVACLVPDSHGIYFVDPKKDLARTVLPFPYVEGALKQTDGLFSSAMDFYITELVHPDDRQKLLEFCHYDDLNAKLRAGKSLEISYRLASGANSTLQVRRPRRSGDDQDEMLWLFTT